VTKKASLTAKLMMISSLMLRILLKQQQRLVKEANLKPYLKVTQFNVNNQWKMVRTMNGNEKGSVPEASRSKE
jgi:hypothetical protein